MLEKGSDGSQLSLVSKDLDSEQCRQGSYLRNNRFQSRNPEDRPGPKSKQSPLDQLTE